MLSVIGLLCPLSNSPIKNCIRFIFIKLEGAKWPIWPCFCRVTKRFANLAMGNCREAKGIFAHLGHGYLPSNKAAFKLICELNHMDIFAIRTLCG